MEKVNIATHTIHLVFLNRASDFAWHTPSRLGWLASEPQGPVLLYLLSNGAVNLYCNPQLFLFFSFFLKVWVLGTEHRSSSILLTEPFPQTQHLSLSDGKE